MRLQFLGCGDAFGSGGQFNTCFHVTTGSTQFLVDCGASSMIAIRRFGVEPNAIEIIFITHLHGDHFGGLPFFVLDAQLVSRRTTPLTMAGPPGLRERLREAMEVLFPGSADIARRFQVGVIELDAGAANMVNGVIVTPFLMKHACGAPPFALRLECDGKSLAYTGDTEWVDALIPAGAQGRPVHRRSVFLGAKGQIPPRLGDLEESSRRDPCEASDPDAFERGYAWPLHRGQRYRRQ